MADQQHNVNRSGGNNDTKRVANKRFGGDKPFNKDRKDFKSGDKVGEKRFGDRPARGDGEKKPYPRRDGKTGFKPDFKPGFKSEGKPGFRSEGKPAFRAEGKPEFKSEGRPAFRGDGKPGFKSEGKPAFRGEKRPFPAKRDDRPRGQYGRPAPAPSMDKRRTEPSDGLKSRRLALEVLRLVNESGAYASLVLDEKLTGSGLSAVDRRLVTRLVYDTLEHRNAIDHALSQVMAKSLDETDIKLLNIMRLAACQILFFDRIPESAATNTAVELCREADMEGLVGVCNGILRNLIRKKEELTWPSEEEDLLHALSVMYTVPEWVAGKLVETYGKDEAKRILGAKAQHPIILRMNRTKVNAAEFEAMLDKKVWRFEKGALDGSYHVYDSLDIGKDTDFLLGRYSIQSECSQMACLAVDVKKGDHVLDVCAAPGGKTCYMAEMMAGTGRVIAWDLHPHRVKLIEAQVARLGLENVRTSSRDAMKLREDLIDTQNAVLIDAPCSGTGDLADKPDIRLRLKEENLAELIATQQTLLETACQYVRKGGTLVYSTCSVFKEENEDQVTAFLNRHPDFELVKMPETIPMGYRQYENVGLQLLQGRDGVGGFYIAKMRRKRV